MKSSGLIVTLHIALSLFIGTLAGCSEIDESRYDSYSSIASAGLFEPNKIFHSVPVEPSAADVIYAFDTDTNEIWVAYRASTRGKLETIERLCIPTLKEKLFFPSRGPGDWWPSDLLDNPSGALPNPESAIRYFECNNHAWIAADKDSEMIFFYRGGS